LISRAFDFSPTVNIPATPTVTISIIVTTHALSGKTDRLLMPTTTAGRRTTKLAADDSAIFQHSHDKLTGDQVGAQDGKAEGRTKTKGRPVEVWR
jgi:hypothetical protein